MSVRRVGSELGARYVVSGSVQMSDEKAVVSVQLSESADERILWGRSFEIGLRELHGVGLTVADEIACALEPSLFVAELDRARILDDDDLEPHHMVLQAKDLMFRVERSDFSKAKAVLDRASPEAPHFGPVHALLAEWHTIDLLQGWTNDIFTSRRALEEHSQRAIRLSPDDGRALALWGHNKIAIDRDYDGALALFEHALRLTPNDAETLIWTVPTLALSGHSGVAVLNGKKSLTLSPVDPFLFRNEHFLSLAHYAQGDFSEASKLGKSAFGKAPDYASNLRVTIASLAAEQRYSEAEKFVDHHNVIEPDFSAREFEARHGFKDSKRRREFVDRLIDAGVPA